MTGVLIVTSLEVREILRPGQQRPLTDFAVRGQALHLQLHAAHHLVHEPVRYAQALLRINESEEDDVTE